MPKTIGEITYYTVAEAADFFGVTKNTIRNYLQAGKLQGYKIGHAIYIPEAEIQKMIKPYKPSE